MQKKRRRKSVKKLCFPEAQKRKGGEHILQDLIQARRAFYAKGLGNNRQASRSSSHSQSMRAAATSSRGTVKKKFLLCDNVFDPFNDDVDPFDENTTSVGDGGTSTHGGRNLRGKLHAWLRLHACVHY